MTISFVADEFGLLHARVPHHTLVNSKMQVMALEGDDGWWVYVDGERVPGAFRTPVQAGKAAEAEIARQKQSTDWLQKDLETQRRRERDAEEQIALRSSAAVRATAASRARQTVGAKGFSGFEGGRALMLGLIAIVFVAIGFGAGHAVGVFEGAAPELDQPAAVEARYGHDDSAGYVETGTQAITRQGIVEGTVEQTAFVVRPRIPVPATVRDLRVRAAAVAPAKTASNQQQDVLVSTNAGDAAPEPEITPSLLSSTSALEAVEEDAQVDAGALTEDSARNLDEEIRSGRENAAFATDDAAGADATEDVTETAAIAPRASTRSALKATRRAPASASKRRARQRRIERRAAKRAAVRRARAARRNRLAAQRRKARRRAAFRTARARKRGPRRHSRAAIRRVKAQRVRRTYRKAFRDTLD
ncbi:MAG: hypothetical protein AAGJ70_00605 [Pseudomonadota bacterium]